MKMRGIDCGGILLVESPFRKWLFTLACLFFAAFLSNCGSGKPKPVLEVSFAGAVEKAPLSYLTTLVGTGGGRDETFGERRNVLIFFEEEDCGTCKEVKPVVSEWVGKRGYSIFSYKVDYSCESQEERESFLRKLGSSDGRNLTAARLVAFVDGKRAGSVSGNYDLESVEKIDSFVGRYFDLSKSFGSAEDRRELSGLKELRRRVADGEKFLLYLSRYTCPHCRKLSNPAEGNVINKLAGDYGGKFYKLISEKSLAELEDAGAFAHFVESGADGILWPGVDNLKRKAEHLEMLVVLGLLPPCPDDDSAFFKAVDDYAFGAGEKFLESDRNVPSFFVSDNIDIKSVKSPGDEDRLLILSEAYRKSGMCDENGNLPHRSLFPDYFAPSLSKLGGDEYYESLKKWLDQKK